MVGILQWVTANIFGTRAGEVKALARRMNKQLTEDRQAALALLHELHSRRTQGIDFRSLGDGSHIFRPRSSRIDGIKDVSRPTHFEHHPEEIMFLPEEICDADYGVNIYEEDPELSEFEDPNNPITKEPPRGHQILNMLVPM